ncbi:ATP-binding protein [Pectinatus haikarae]|uniref:ATP-binding protein n=1 Tax=Pectinatus haikarae TaxID=349096 RepID=UPI002ED95157
MRPLLTVAIKNGIFFVSAEIPGIDLAERPCYYQGKGRLKGSYTRIGDSDEPMTEYEIYSYEAYRKKYQDDIRAVNRVTLAALNKELLDQYVQKLKAGKANLSAMKNEDIYELMSIKRNGEVTLSATLVFSPYPQAYFPQLCITAVVVPGTKMGETGKSGERFLDNQRIEGNILDLLNEAIRFVKKNMRTKTIINSETGQREDRTDYPITAVREAIINALVHRDYSIHTEGMPIQIVMFDDRLEIHNPGGVYGRIRVDQLGKVQPDTRNPVLASELEILDITENRYSGIPTIRLEMEKYNLTAPEFIDARGSFVVKFYKRTKISDTEQNFDDTKDLLVFCKTPRNRREICEYLGLSSVTYAIQRHVIPLVETGRIKLSIPDKPKSPKQLYYSE